MADADDLANLKTRRSQIYSELAAMTPNSAQPGGRPSGGGNLDHVGYKDGLYRELSQINKQILALDVFEVTTEMVT